VAWSPDGTRIASGGDGLEVRVWDARDGRLRQPVLREPGRVHWLAWSPNSRRLAAGSFEDDQGAPQDGLTVWDTASGARVLRVGQVRELRSVAFSPDGSRLAAGGAEGIVRVFDAADGRERAALFTGCLMVSGLAFSPDGRRLYAGGWGMGGVKVFDPARDPRGRGIPSWLDQLAALTFDRDGLRVLGVAWDAGALASVDPFDGVVKVEQALPVTDSLHWPRGDFAFSPDCGRVAAPTRWDGTVVGVWDLALGRPVTLLRGSGGPVTAVAFRPDGRALATAAAGGQYGRSIVTLWDLASRRAIRTFEAGADPVQALAFSGDGRRLAAGGGIKGGPGRVTAWDSETGAVLGTLDRVGLVTSLAFHPDGARLAVADYGETRVHLWDLAAGTLITNPGPGAVSCVGFTPDGKRLAALGYDGNVHLADARTGDEVLVLRSFGPPPGAGGFTPRLAFSPDGSRIAGHYAIGQMLNLWDLGPTAGLAAEPEAGDLAGWLRRSRALAERGDLEGAEAASARARTFEDRDPSP
jgi:WD40 repeat protein